MIALEFFYNYCTISLITVLHKITQLIVTVCQSVHWNLFSNQSIGKNQAFEQECL